MVVPDTKHVLIFQKEALCLRKRGEKFGIAVEYPTFELLWFDIEWRCRELIEKLVAPIKDRMTDDED